MWDQTIVMLKYVLAVKEGEGEVFSFFNSIFIQRSVKILWMCACLRAIACHWGIFLFHNRGTFKAGSFVAEQTILNQGKSRADIDSVW